MAYFQELSEKYSPNSLWTKYSTLRSTLMVYKNIDISQYHRLISFLKVKSKGYVPKKSKVLEGEQIIKFIKKAPDDNIYLVHKFILVMGVGGLRRDELVTMTIDDIEDRGTVLVIKVPETKTLTSKSFTIIEEDLGALNLIKKYAALRPAGIKERRFFLTYRKSRYTVQPVGKNTIGSVPTLIAKFLKLDNAEAYTGHCLRRTSSTLLVEAGASFEMLKQHGKWKSSSVAEGYIEESISSKNKVAKMIANSVNSVSTIENSLMDNLQTIQNSVSAATSTITKNTDHSIVGSATFSRTFQNCNFYFGNF
ncbi:uncharacterized protein LOC126738053 isoform X2 [Anthonomus grandis grandis]|uniref:uncharacterized protein LOC126738053 isoform X2 n=1 Tax=Anthonomus grandis grandis TaxID=2921223 RepID=UPI0021669794|nr:uncharacterized protein LOC126738053 isoform X2 [Anthonomus grandis grandis]